VPSALPILHISHRRPLHPHCNCGTRRRRVHPNSLALSTRFLSLPLDLAPPYSPPARQPCRRLSPGPQLPALPAPPAISRSIAKDTPSLHILQLRNCSCTRLVALRIIVLLFSRLSTGKFSQPLSPAPLGLPAVWARVSQRCAPGPAASTTCLQRFVNHGQPQSSTCADTSRLSAFRGSDQSCCCPSLFKVPTVWSLM
jgi:hypothetical protein